MIDDVGELIVSQAQVQSMQNTAEGGNGEVEFKVPVRVPTQRCDAVAGLQSGLRQHVGEAMGARVKFGVGVAMNVIGKLAGDFTFAEEARYALKNRRNRERVVHHQALQRGGSHEGQGITTPFERAVRWLLKSKPKQR